MRKSAKIRATFPLSLQHSLDQSSSWIPLAQTTRWLALTALLLAGCAKDDPSKNATPIPLSPWESRELILMTREGPTTYFRDYAGNPSGFEYNLAQQFAHQLGLPLKIVSTATPEDAYAKLRRGEAHLAALGLSSNHTPLDLRAGPHYFNTQPALIYNTDQLTPENWEDLNTLSVGLLNSTAQQPWFQQLQQQHPQIHWKILTSGDEETLLQEVSFNRLDFCLIDKHWLELLKNVYLNVDTAFEATAPQSLAWSFPANSPAELIHQAELFFTEIKKNGALQHLNDQYYGHLDRLKINDASKFRAKTHATLPKFRRWFEEAARQTGLDWRLIAAIAYQESQWDPLATSPTNVRGMMMLTEETAAHLGVNNRLDAKESILAGAHYLKQLKQQLRQDLGEPDRTWLALAAYNLGPAHLEDVFSLTKKLRLNAKKWGDIKKTLPLLSRNQYYPILKYGPAKGGAAVIFTESVRAYYDVLTKMETFKTPSLALQSYKDPPIASSHLEPYQPSKTCHTALKPPLIPFKLLKPQETLKSLSATPSPLELKNTLYETLTQQVEQYSKKSSCPIQ